MDKQTLIEQVAIMNMNFQLGKSKEEVKEYCQVIYPFLIKNNVTEKMLLNAVGTFIERTTGSNFNKLPSVGDFLSVLGLTPKSHEETAGEQAEVVLSNLSNTQHDYMVMFDDPVTNFVIQNTFGGTRKMQWCLDDSNPEKEKPVWLKKRFVEAYLVAHDKGLKQNQPVKNSQNEIYGNKVKFIGNEDEARKMIALPERQENAEMNKMIENITKGMKA